MSTTVRILGAAALLLALGLSPLRAAWATPPAGADAPGGHALLPTIQASTVPVILISGIGLLLLTMTNRMGRIVDRTRVYAAMLREAQGEERRQLEVQLKLTWRRAKIVRLSLTFAVSSMLASAALTIAIFLDAEAHVDLGRVMLVLFLCAIALLVAALLAFLRDIFVSLAALRREVEQALKP
jgi:hypothetical protein